MSIDVPGGATSKHEHGASLDLLSRAFYPKKSPMPANSFLEEITLENSALLLIDHQVGTNLVDGAQTDLEFRDAVRALVGAAKNYDIPTLITDSVPQGLNDNTVNWITQLYPDHKVWAAHKYSPSAERLQRLADRVEQYLNEPQPRLATTASCQDGCVCSQTYCIVEGSINDHAKIFFSAKIGRPPQPLLVEDSK